MTGEILVGIYVFVLATLVGFEVITGANAISGIAVVGALVVSAHGGGTAVVALGFAAIVMATINVVGGFMVTDRMLQMFKRD
jgi:NAD(P) transhydrogenase subunit alpha